MLRVEVVCALCLVSRALASLSEKAAARTYVDRVATFGGAEGLSGTLTLQDVLTLQAVQWVTSDIMVPGELVSSECGELSENETLWFEYGIHEAWRHSNSSDVGDQCGEHWTGGSWDPTAVCSSRSLNGACFACSTHGVDYQCSPETFDSGVDGRGNNNDLNSLGA